MIGAKDGARDRVDGAVVDERSVRQVDFSAASVNGIIGLVLLAVEILLATRFMLIAFAANRANGFVDFILDVSWPFVRPFSSAFATHRWDQGIIEPASLLAMGVYAIAAALVMLLVAAIVPTYRTRRDVATRRGTRF